MLCENFVEHEESGRRDLIGIFDVLNVSGLPVTLERCFAFFSVAGSGTVDFNFALTSPDGQLVHFGGFRISEWGKMGICESAVTLHDLKFLHPGTYLLRLFTGDQTVLERSIDVRIG